MIVNKLLLLVIVSTIFVSCTNAHVGGHGKEQQQQPHYIERLQSLPSYLSCDICQIGATLLTGYLEANASTDVVIAGVVDLCTKLKIELPDVCQGIMNAYVPILWNVIIDTDMQPSTLCDVFKLCQSNSTSTKVVQQPEEEIMTTQFMKADHGVKYADLSQQRPIHSNGTLSGKGYILQLADIHFDAYYLEGSNPNCGRPLCCRDGTGDAGFFGHYLCDIPLVTVKTMFERISEMAAAFPIDFIVWTGDNPPHDVWMQSEEKQTTATEVLTELVKEFFPNTIVFPSIGNHESWPADQFILPDKQWLLNSLSTFWAPFLGDDQLTTVQEQGYYTLLVQPGLRIVSLNTQDADMINFYNLMTLNNMNKPNNQTNWIANVLSQAQANSEKVIIIGHIPCTAKAAANDRWCSIYQQIVDTYQDTIVAQIYGHTHDDQLVVLTDVATNSHATGMQYVAPSLTTYQNHEPGFRVYEFDYTTNQVTNYYQYHCNLTEANLTGNLTFSLTYSAKEMYGMPDLTPHSWYDVANSMKTNTTIFNNYYKHMTNSPNPLKPCDLGCQHSIACEIFGVTSELFDICQLK